MRDRTLKELRALARRQGLTGYSGLRKHELLRRLARHRPAPPEPVRKSRNRPDHAAAPAAASPRRAKRRAAAGKRRSAPADPARPAAPAQPAPSVGVGFGADTGCLPPLPDVPLGLLPRKHGILHGYWTLEPGALQRQPGLCIRLCRIHDRVLEVLAEIPLPGDSGRWYFHVGQMAAETPLFAQLGHYTGDGTFLTAIDRGIARLPGPSTPEECAAFDWWISEPDFRKMYVRSDGVTDHRHLLWCASVSSC